MGATVSAEKALFEGQIHGLIVTAYQNERPPCGLAGMLDWHFQGAISQLIMQGVITGRTGECVYLPILRRGSLYHILLAGSGHSLTPGHRGPVQADTIHAVQKNIITLGLPKLGISKSDFGQTSSDYFSKQLKGASLWIGP